MLTKSLIIITLVTLTIADGSSEKSEINQKQQRSSHIDRWNKYIDRQFTEPLTFHYLWPWSQLFKAVAALDEDAFEEPKVVSNKEKYEVHLNVKRFKPDELKIRVKNRNIIVEGKHKESNQNQQFLANHFVQNFVIPAGCKPEEVKAVIKENGVLTISVPRHELPPPPPEREVPIEVLVTEKPATTESTTITEKTEREETTPTTEKKETHITSSATPLEQLELVESTTLHGKIRKKELKDQKPSKANEVTKGLEENGLDYALIDNE